MQSIQLNCQKKLQKLIDCNVLPIKQRGEKVEALLAFITFILHLYMHLSKTISFVS